MVAQKIVSERLSRSNDFLNSLEEKFLRLEGRLYKEIMNELQQEMSVFKESVAKELCAIGSQVDIQSKQPVEMVYPTIENEIKLGFRNAAVEQEQTISMVADLLDAMSDIKIEMAMLVSQTNLKAKEFPTLPILPSDKLLIRPQRGSRYYDTSNGHPSTYQEYQENLSNESANLLPYVDKRLPYVDNVILSEDAELVSDEENYWRTRYLYPEDINPDSFEQSFDAPIPNSTSIASSYSWGKGPDPREYNIGFPIY